MKVWFIYFSNILCHCIPLTSTFVYLSHIILALHCHQYQKHTKIITISLELPHYDVTKYFQSENCDFLNNNKNKNKTKTKNKNKTKQNKAKQNKTQKTKVKIFTFYFFQNSELNFSRVTSNPDTRTLTTYPTPIFGGNPKFLIDMTAKYEFKITYKILRICFFWVLFRKEKKICLNICL